MNSLIFLISLLAYSNEIPIFTACSNSDLEKKMCLLKKDDQQFLLGTDKIIYKHKTNNQIINNPSAGTYTQWHKAHIASDGHRTFLSVMIWSNPNNKAQQELLWSLFEVQADKLVPLTLNKSVSIKDNTKSLSPVDDFGIFKSKTYFWKYKSEIHNLE